MREESRFGIFETSRGMSLSILHASRTTLTLVCPMTERKHLHQHPLQPFHGTLLLSPLSNGTLPKTHVSPPLELMTKLHYGIFQSRRTRTSDLPDLKQIDSRTFPLNYSSVTKAKKISRKFIGILKYPVPSSRPLQMDSTSSKLYLSPPRLFSISLLCT